MKCCRNGIIKFIRYNLFFTRSLGQHLAERKGKGWNPNSFFPTPHTVCEFMTWSFKRIPDFILSSLQYLEMEQFNFKK